MTLTLLLDLDDTLLTNRFEPFLEAYLHAWGKFIRSKIAPDLFVKQLLAGTQAMLINNNPELTLEQVFDAEFYPALGSSKEDLRETLDQFYREVYPELRSHTSPRPEAIELVELAVRKGFRIGVATNPLFPRTAILQRLEWAGLPPRKYPFEVISSFETFHFSKPNPAYYAEFLGQMGWPTQPVVMVGNSYSDDILPSLAAGLHAYLLVEPGNSDGKPTESLEYPNGSMRDLIGWLDRLDPAQLQPRFSTPEAIKTILRSTPAALSTLSSQAPTHIWNIRPYAGEWSLTEILCHLRDVETEVNLPRLKTALSMENPFIAGIDTDPWAIERHYIDQDGPAAFRDFLCARQEVLQIIDKMPPQTWLLPLRHAIFGPSTIGEIIGFFATHDRSHLQQFRQNMTRLETNRLKSPGGYG